MKRKQLNFHEDYARMYPNSAAKSVTFVVTYDCNLRCDYCYEHHKSGARMSFATARDCVDLLFREDERGNPLLGEQKAGALILEFIGGEPLLEIDLISRTVDYVREVAMRKNHRWATHYMSSITTNGLNYFAPGVQQFLRENAGRVSLGVTLDGDELTHNSCRKDACGCGSYACASSAFAHAKRVFGQEGTKFTIAPGNVERVFVACRDLIERYNLRLLHCNCVYEEGWEVTHAQTLYTELKRLADWVLESGRDIELSIFDSSAGRALPDSDTQNWCGGTGKMLCFDVDGTVYPCLRYTPLALGEALPALRIGDCKRGLGHAPEHVAVLNQLEAVTRQSQSSAACLACPVASGCGWCSAYNYERFGSVNHRATFLCQTHQARVLAAEIGRAHV